MSGRAVLYSFRRCPYAMRARMALLVSGVACELREVILRDKPAAMIAASPKATVPVLVLPDGGVIDESLEIMLWSLGKDDPEDWLGGYDAALIAGNDGAFKHHLDRYKYPERHRSDPAEHRAAGVAMLAALEERLSVHGNLCRPARALADAALMPFVRQFAETDRGFFDALPLPAVQRWLQSQVESDLFRQAMIRLPAWRPGDPPEILDRNPACASPLAASPAGL